MNKREENLKTAIHHVKSPEELEVEQLIEQIEERKERIAELELELETLRQGLGRFQAEIDRRLGPLYIELDRLNLRRRRYEARIERLKRGRKQAGFQAIEREIAEEFQREWEDLKDKEKRARAAQQESSREYVRSEEEEAELKKLYRKLAKRFHPDLAGSEPERIHGLQVMSEINGAYAEKDLERLRLIEAREYPETEQVREPIGEKLVRLIRRRHQFDQVLTRLESQIAELRAGETCKLMEKVKEEAGRGKDLISVWESELKAQISQAETNLKKVIEQFKDLVVETFWGPLD